MDNLPNELIFRDVKKISNHIENRERIQVLPQNGVEFTASSQIVIRFPANEGESIDFNSMTIHADLQITGLPSYGTTAISNLYDETPDTAIANGMPVVMCHDSCESLIRRVHVLVNGSELELVDYYDQLETSMNNWINSNWCNVYGSGAMLMNLDVLDRTRCFIPSSTYTISNNESAKVSVAIPLRFLALSNLSEILPTYLMGGGQSSIEVRIFLNAAVDCVKAGTLTRSVASQAFLNYVNTTNTLGYKLSDVRINYDVVRTSQEYQDALSQYLLENSVTIPFMTYYNNIYNIW